MIHPLDHGNLGQSTNDVHPTAVRLTLVASLRRLGDSLGTLATAFTEKAAEFGDALKMGRTQLQDAVPMTLGQEFTTYAVMIEEDRRRLVEAAALLLESNLGGTAIDTGINGHPCYAELARAYLAETSGEPVRPARALIEATQDCGAFVQLSGVPKRVAVKLSKTCNDLRPTSSGPTTGFGEINLPPMQASSSIMPGKVNPVIPRGRQPGRLRGHRQRPDRHRGRRSRTAPAQRLRTRHRLQPAALPDPSARGLRHPGHPLRPRHHRQPRTPPRQPPPLHRAGHRTRTPYRLRRLRHRRPAGPDHRTRRQGPRRRGRSPHSRSTGHDPAAREPHGHSARPSTPSAP